MTASETGRTPTLMETATSMAKACEEKQPEEPTPSTDLVQRLHESASKAPPGDGKKLLETIAAMTLATERAKNRQEPFYPRPESSTSSPPRAEVQASAAYLALVNKIASENPENSGIRRFANRLLNIKAAAFPDALRILPKVFTSTPKGQEHIVALIREANKLRAAQGVEPILPANEQKGLAR